MMFVFMGTNIMFWNCQGVRPKHKELESYLKENNFDMVALNETFLTKEINFKSKVMIQLKMIVQLVQEVAFLVKHGLVINKEYCNIGFNIITNN